MKKRQLPVTISLLSAMLLLDSCSVITGIFKAGAAAGIIAVIIVAALLIWIISLFRSKNS